MRFGRDRISLGIRKINSRARVNVFGARLPLLRILAFHNLGHAFTNTVGSDPGRAEGVAFRQWFLSLGGRKQEGSYQKRQQGFGQEGGRAVGTVVS